MWRIALFVLLTTITCEVIEDDRSFDNLNVQKLHDNPDRLQAYLDCVLDEGECYEIDARIKRRALNIVSTSCGDCSQKEKAIFRDLSWIIMTKKISYAPRIIRKYDKTGNMKNLMDSLSDVPSLLNLPKISGTIIEEFIKKSDTN